MTYNKKGSIILHVGLHKTGTSFLQDRLFSLHPQINYVRNSRIEDVDIRDDMVNVLSWEWFSGRPYWYDISNRYELMDRLKYFFPGAEILVVLRNTDSWLDSIYGQYVLKGGTKNEKDFFDGIFDFEYLRFDKYIDSLRKIFHSVNVLWYEDFKEDNQLFCDKVCSIVGVDSFRVKSGLVNKSMNKWQFAFIRLCNRILPNSFSVYFWGKMNHFLR